MKQTILLLSLLTTQFSVSQCLDWVVSGNFIDLDIQFTSMDEQRNTVLGGEFRRTTNLVTGEEFLVDGQGKSTEIPLNHSYSRHDDSWFNVVSYNADGALKWHLEIQKENVELHGISHNKGGNILLLVHVFCQFTESGEDGETDDDETHGWFPELYPSEEQTELWQAGYYVVRLSSNGGLINRTLLFEGQQDLEIEFDDFQSYINEGFLIHGLAERRFNYPEKIKSPLIDEGHVVFAFDSVGKLLWTDLIQYPGGVSGFYRSIASSSDGSVYLTGTANRGLDFSNGQKVKMDPALFAKNRQSYLVAYSPQGKIRWLKLSKTNATVHQVEATNDQVFMSYLISPSEISAFGFLTDTLGGKRLVTSSFSTDGKNLWSFAEVGIRVHDLKVKDNTVYIYAQQPLKRQIEKIDGKNKIKFEYSYLSRYTTQGKFIRSEIYPFDVGNDEINAFLFPFSDKEIYISANFSEGFLKSLNELDLKFGNLKGQGWPGMTARLKRK